MKKYVIAFSGGADSRYLLETFLEKIEKGDLKKNQLILAHYNHNLRGSESKRDQEFSREIAQKMEMTFETETRSKDDSLSENAARNIRYDFLEKVRLKYNADWIVTAHHKDDQAETIFMQFLRGGGVHSLAGMKTYADDRKIFRPLLSISKEEILNILSQKNISFVEDSTNAESDFTRNFFRNEVFPLIEKKIPGFASRIAEKSTYFQTIQDGFEHDAASFLKEHSSFLHDGISRHLFLGLSSGVQFEIIKTLISPSYCSQKLFKGIFDFIHHAESGKKFCVKNTELMIFGEKFFLQKGK